MQKKNVKRTIVLAVIFMLYGHASYAQTEALLDFSGPFYDELNGVVEAYEDSTGTDTVRFPITNVTNPADIWGPEMLTSSQLLTLINTYDFKVDHGTNNIIFEQSEQFSLDAVGYERRFSYTAERKILPKVVIDNTLYTNLFCLHLFETASIYAQSYETPMTIENNYYVLYDGSTLIGIITYNEMKTAGILYTQKLVDLSGSTMKPSSIIALDERNTMKLAPNPANTTVKIDVILDKSEKATLVLADMTGKKLREIELGNLDAKKIMSRTEDVSKLPSGVYMVLLITPTVQKVTKLTIAK